MDVLMTILSILLFIVALGILVTIHELGHFIAAKSFGVYCDTFSIGFGPKFVKIKPKKAETRFTIGIIPFGGYVSMYGEDNDEDDKKKDDNDNSNPFKDIPRSRSLQGVSRIKRIITMSAGIIMNFVLAYLIFFISSVSFPQLMSDPYINVVSILNDEKFDNHFRDSNGNLLTLEDKEFISDQSVMGMYNLKFNYTYIDLYGKEVTNEYTIANLVLSNSALLNDNEKLSLSFSTANYGYSNTDYANHFNIYKSSFTYGVDETSKGYSNIMIYNSLTNEYVAIPEGYYFNMPAIGEDGNPKTVDLNINDTIKMNVCFSSTKENDKTIKFATMLLNVKEDNTFEEIGLGMYTDFQYIGWDAFRYAGEQWVDSTGAIANALAQLFYSSDAWNNVGGPVAIFSQTTQILSNYPFNYYLNSWGIISVNLALFNLLPFPGLDGWQILVELIEGSVNGVKKLSKKVKNKKKEKTNPNLEVTKNVEDNSTIVKYDKTSIIDDKASANKNSELVVGETKEEKEKIPYDDEWHINPKVKNIVSTIGLILLFGLMIVIVFKDIFALF